MSNVKVGPRFESFAFLQVTQTLQTLRLSGNNLHIDELLGALAKNKSLTMLDVSKCSLGDKGTMVRL